MSNAGESGRRDNRRRLVLEAGLLGAVALALRLLNLDHTPYVDELNHVMAAASLLSEGTPLLDGTGEYTRALLFTRMVAASYMVFGESLVAARVPAVMAGTLLVVITFLWVRTAAGRWEGWTAGLLLMLAPQAIYHSQLARFYSFQALFVVGAAWCVYALVTSPVRSWRHPRAWVLAGGAAVLGIAAMSIQISSLVGLSGIAAWFLVLLGRRALKSGRPLRSYRVAASAIALAALGTLIWLQLSGTLHGARAAFQHVSIWAEGQQDHLRFYHNYLLSHFPLLWAPFPLVAVVALRRNARPVSLWLAVFILVFGVHTLAPQNATRYIFYALPFFFAVTGIVAGPLLRRLFVEFRALVSPWLGPRPATMVGAGAFLLCLIFAAWGNSAASYTARMVAGDDAAWPFEIRYRGESDWRGVAADLGHRIEEVSVVLTSTELKALYFLGRNDLILSANYLGRDEHGSPREAFSRNWKTDRPMIVRPSSIDLIVNCRPSGLILVEDNHWRRAWSVPPESADVIESLTQEIDLEPGRRVRAFQWDHGDDFAPPASQCHQIPG